MSKKIKIAAGANPFDKSRSAAESFIYPQESNTEAETSSEKTDEHVGHVGTVEQYIQRQQVGTVGDVDTVEQQSQQVQQVQQSQQDDAKPEKGTKKTKTRHFPGKQHVHLLLPDNQANMIKELAKFSGVSVNQFMQDTLENLYQEKWKNVYDMMQQMQHKMGLDKKGSKDLFES